MIQARIVKRYRPGPESAGFTLDLQFQSAAGVTVLFGPSGAGKTLTLDSIAGFVKPEEGRILLDDDLLFDGAAGVHLPPQARRCGYVFQNYALFPHMTLRQNLEFAAERRPRLERHRKVNEMLDCFRLADVAGRKPHELSGGQKQRCSIARALISDPKLLLLDEPARGLDGPLRAELYGVLRQVQSEFSTPILLVTHDLEECFELGDEMLVVRDGKLAQSGPPKSVLDQPANLEVARLFSTFNLLAAEIRALDPGRNSSRVRLCDFNGQGEFEIDGPYFPGRLLGDRVWLCVRPQELRVGPRNEKPGGNQVPVELMRVVERPQSVRLEFRGDLAVELTRRVYEEQKQNREWLVEFPSSALRLL